MAKIVLSFMNGLCEASADEVPCFFEAFTNGLRQCGNDILVVDDYGFKKAGDLDVDGRILERVKQFDPDLIIAFNNFGIDYQKDFECPIIVYEVDSPLLYCNKGLLKKYPDRYSYIVSQNESVEQIKYAFGCSGSRIEVVPFFSEVQAEDIEKTINISFIGSAFKNGLPHWQRFRAKHPSIEDSRLYSRLLHVIAEDPYFDISKENETYGKLNLNQADVVTLMGDLSAERRIQVLMAIADLGLALFGSMEWMTAGVECHDLYCAFNHRQLFSLRQNQDLYNASKVCLNINHLQARSGFSWRVCDIMASSGCLVSEYKSNLLSLFPDVPIPTFTNKFEAREQCLRVLRNDNLRADIVSASQRAINERFRFKNILPQVESVAGMTLRGDSPGSVSYVPTKVARDDSRFSATAKYASKSLATNAFRLFFYQLPFIGNFVNKEKALRKVVRNLDIILRSSSPERMARWSLAYEQAQKIHVNPKL